MSNNSKKYHNFILIFTLLVMGIGFYFLLGQEWISIQDDSTFYLNPSSHEGVMPLYPLFVFGIKMLFGEKIYLSVIVIIQSALALICTMIFTLYLQKQFHLKWFEGILLYIACMLPFSIYLPESGITHQIMTEGIAFSLFYIYFLFLIQYIFSKKSIRIFPVTGTAFILALTRSQLLFLFIPIALAFIYVQIRKHKMLSRIKAVLAGLLYLLLGMIATLILVMSVYKVYGFYMVCQLPVIAKWGQEQTEETRDEIVETAETPETSETKKKKVPDNKVTMSQLTSLVMIRGFYEADEADVDLFESSEMKEIFLRVYKAVDEKQYRYVYARQDLYMWKDLICDRIPNVAYEEATQYLHENPQLELKERDIIEELGIKVLLRHFDRYLYHTFRMMISGFISSVFFQIERIYFLCHMITLTLFIMALVCSATVIRLKRNAAVAEMMLSVTIYIIMQVTVINVIFFGLQRYMVYAMGIFYCSLYLVMRELFICFLEKRGRKIEA